MMALATVAVVVAVVAGVALGHVVWPTSSTAAVSASPSIGSGGTGSSGSGGTGSSPFGSGYGGSGSSSFGSGSGGSGSSSSGNTSTGAGAPSDISAIAAKVSPALVDINTNLSYQDEQAAGTGMVLTSDGEILTNNHVIDGATSISVTDVGNGKTYSASVVGYDRTGDVAVIKLSGASGLQTITASTTAAAVGQAVVGVGNAGGTGGTPSNAGGSITALDQSITASDDGGGNAENLTGLIETNAGIEPGDSGGSLVNTSGQVIGMDTAASADSGYDTSATQGYAIPIQTALSVAHKIIDGQASSTIHIGATGFLGLAISTTSDSSSGDNGGFGDGSGGFSFGGGSDGSGSDGSGSSSSGAVVAQVLSGSAAGKAGVAVGDTIDSLNGQNVSSPTDLTNLLESEHPGDVVQLQWTDQSGQTHTASVTLGSGPPA
jgi:S1-C subfamily serine protease